MFARIWQIYMFIYLKQFKSDISPAVVDKNIELEELTCRLYIEINWLQWRYYFLYRYNYKICDCYILSLFPFSSFIIISIKYYWISFHTCIHIWGGANAPSKGLIQWKVMVFVTYGLLGKKVKEGLFGFLVFLATYIRFHFPLSFFSVNCIRKIRNYFFHFFRIPVMRASAIWKHYLSLYCFCISATWFL